MINRTLPLGQYKGTYQQPNIFGYYGNFGGAYIPEMLHRNVEELKTRYIQIMYDAEFQKEFRDLLKNYVGRPTPLYFAKRLSAQYKTRIFLKREDLCIPRQIPSTGCLRLTNNLSNCLSFK